MTYLAIDSNIFAYYPREMKLCTDLNRTAITLFFYMVILRAVFEVLHLVLQKNNFNAISETKKRALVSKKTMLP